MNQADHHLSDALDAATLARTKAEYKASQYQADPVFNEIAGLCAVAQIEIRRAMRPLAPVDSIISPTGARAL